MKLTFLSFIAMVALLCSSGTCLADSAHQKKIVGLLAVRNESFFIEQCLKALACYTDAIVVLDDASDDNTLDLIHSLKDVCHIEVILTKQKWCGDEPGDRNKLLEAGRRIGGTHFICIDADEMLTANCMINNRLRNYILALEPGDTLSLYWIQLWRSIDLFRFDNIDWAYKYKKIIFCDTPSASYSSECIDTVSVPSTTGRQRRLESYVYGLLHFQFVNWENLLIKNAWCRCLEHIHSPKKSAYDINQRYKASTDETNLKLKPARKEWFEGYDFLHTENLTAQESWRTKQLFSWFDNYGTDFFKDLDIWDIDWPNSKTELSNSLCSIRINICTAADHKYFDQLINLIGSICRVNYHELNQIIVFDLGMTDKQIKRLNTIAKVLVKSVETTHPDILKPMKVNNDGKIVPGWYAWKPVILHQMAEQYPHFMYIDAGTTILKPLNCIYAHMLEKGYFLVDCGHSIRRMVTKRVTNYFNLDSAENRWILDESVRGCAGGLIGATEKVYDSFITKMYDLSHHIELFEDDGTAIGCYHGTSATGFGTARHDQALFSVIARQLNFEIFLEDNGGNGRLINLEINRYTVPLHITWKKDWVRNNTTIYHSRGDMRIDYFSQFIRYKKV